MRLQGKTAIITGAGAGYGAAMARRFAAEAARVACADIDLAAAQKTAGALSGAIAVQCDVSKGDSVARMVADVVAAFGGFDVLVNNAALSQKPGRVAKIAEADLDRLLAVNVKGIYHMAVHAAPVLRKAGGACMINIVSVNAIRPRPGMTWYNASKAAVLSLTYSMAAELAPDKIRVNAIAPVAGRTPMLEAMFGDQIDAAVGKLIETIPLGRLAEPDDIAAAAVYLASDEASFVTGVVIPVDGGRLTA